MTDLDRLRDDLLAFSIAIGLPLEPFQAESLSLAKRTSVLLSARQTGKSRALVAVALHRAFVHARHRVLVVSASEAASKRLLAEAGEVARSSSLLSGSITDETGSLLKLTNKSTILSVAASEKAIRGLSISTLLLDECAQLTDDLVFGAALPTTAARPDARIVMASQAGDAAGAFYDFCESDSPSIEVSRWPLQAAVWIPPEVIAQARETLPPAVFNREFLCIFGGLDAETLIPHEWVQAAQRRTLEPGPTVYAVDIARGGDQNICLKLAGGVARVAWADRSPDLMATAGRVAATAHDERGPSVPVWIDVTGLGYGVYDRLRELGVNAHPFVASGRAANPARHLNQRAQSWMLLRESLRLGNLDLDPQDKVLASQLSGQKYGIASGGQIQIEAKTGSGSPDRADALVIAVQAQSSLSRGEQIARLAAEMRDQDRKRGPLQLAEVELGRELDGLTAEEALGSGGKRGSWRDRLDPDLDEMEGIR